MYIHLPEEITDTRPWLCINQVPYDETNEDETLNTIKDKLTEIQTETLGTNIEIEALHRKITHLPSTLILFKTIDKIQENTLLNTKLNINNRTHKINKYIDKTQIQCTKCRQIGHLRGTCRNKYACPRCASEHCPPGNCRNNFRRCVNCKEAHASTYKGCKILKKHTEDRYKEKAKYSKTDRIQENQKRQEEQIQNLNKNVKNTENLQDEINKLKQEIDIRDNKINELINIFNKKTNQMDNIMQTYNNKTKLLNIQIKENINYIEKVLPNILIRCFEMKDIKNINIRPVIKSIINEVNEEYTTLNTESQLINDDITLQEIYNNIDTPKNQHVTPNTNV